MSNDINTPTVGGKGNYDGGYARFLKAYQDFKGECPRGVTLKLQKTGVRYNLLLQFKQPPTGKRLPKTANLECTPEGVIDGVKKAKLVSEALGTISSASEFWDWYDKTILGKNQIEDNLITYREIFQQLEDGYFAGYNRNTGRPRSRDIVSDLSSYEATKGIYFRLFPNWDEYPSWESFKAMLYIPLQNGEQLVGSKTFKERYYILKAIAEKSPNKEHLLKQLEPINAKQTQFKKKQRIGIDAFKDWWYSAKQKAYTIKSNTVSNNRHSWLWVTGMAVMYGLRPTEIAAAVNLTKPFVTDDGITIKALSDPDNQDNYLVLGDYVYFTDAEGRKVSIKTGGRIVAPIPSPEMFKLLELKQPLLPEYSPKKGVQPRTITGGFDTRFTQKISSMKCPVTQKYAFRRLYNLLGEKYGLPIELRARLMGHSTIVNESNYKTKGIDATLEVIEGCSKLPIPLNVAIERLAALGVDLDSSEAKLFL
ncbi:recombinase [Limnospira sp. Paracas R14]|uniref:recombinase n=1 Tax=Limnospira sp. Paracas R14 TaxID=2981108 RepID=UPI0028E0F239|nr:recombinase [Limnospira sp. Paracas R14]